MTEPLFDLPPAPAGPSGPVEDATRRSITAAGLDPRDEGAAAALLVQAWALDRFRRDGKPYGPTHGLPPYMDAATALGLTPAGRKEEQSDGLDALIAELTRPAVGDPPNT